MDRLLLSIYILSLPFVSAFTISETFTYTIIISVLLLLKNSITFFFKPSIFFITNSFLICLISFLFLIFLLISLFSANINVKSINHYIAYFSCFVLFFLNIYYSFYYTEPNNSINLLSKLIKVLTIILVISSLFTLGEFVSSNIFGFNLNTIVPRPKTELFNALSLGEFYRVRGFASESSNHALMLELLAPLSIYYYTIISNNRYRKSIRFLLILLFLLSIVITYSTAAFLIIAFVSTILLLYNFRYFLKNSINVKSIFVLSIISIFVFKYNETFFRYFNLIQVINNKLNGSTSLTDRTNRFESFTTNFESSNMYRKLIGYGPSGFRFVNLKESFVAFYPTLLFESGILGFTFFTIFIIYTSMRLYSIQSSIKPFLVFPLLVMLLHFFVIGDFWLPWFWFICAIIHYIALIEKNNNIQKMKLI